MEAVQEIVAELHAILPSIARLACELHEKGDAWRAATLAGHLKECSQIASSLEEAAAQDDGGTALRAMVSIADDTTLLAAALVMVMSVDAFPNLELATRLRDLSDRLEAVMWKLDRLGKSLPAPQPHSLN